MMVSCRSSLMRCLLLLSCLLCAAVFARAEDNDQIAKRYQAERAACELKQAEQERTDCRREAAAARDEAVRGGLFATDMDYDRNALARCDALPEADRDLCRRRTRGEGVVEGSVSEGGIYREYRVITLPDAIVPGIDARRAEPAASAK